jgi:hypothetical protein
MTIKIMSTSTFSRATHFSVVWGITLALLTILDWNSLGRDPTNEQILLPFISREITLTSPPSKTEKAEAVSTSIDELDFGSTQPNMSNNPKPLQYNVDIQFNGPYFLACFFIPILAFQLIGLMLSFGRKDE